MSPHPEGDGSSSLDGKGGSGVEGIVGGGDKDGDKTAKRYGVRAGAFLSKGSRSEQEDRFVIWQGRHPVAGPLSIFAVFDGHCGAISVDVCRLHVVSEIVRHASWDRLGSKVKNGENSCDDEDADDRRLGDVESTTIDVETKTIISGILRDVIASLECRCLTETRRARSYDGTTVCIAIVYRGVCHVAHVGDCRALLIRTPSLSTAHDADEASFSSSDVKEGAEEGMDMEGDVETQTPKPCRMIIERLTNDHKVRLSKEARRITSAGGVIRRGRFMGIHKDLDITRALGDRDFKDLDHTLRRPHATLIPDPDITHCILSNPTRTTIKTDIKSSANTNCNTTNSVTLPVISTASVFDDATAEPDNRYETFLLLATDGLSDIVGFDDHAIGESLLRTLREGGSLSDAARTVVNEGICFRDRDNSTALIAHVVPDRLANSGLDFGFTQPEYITNSPTKGKGIICDYWLASDTSPRRRRKLSSWIRSIIKQDR